MKKLPFFILFLLSFGILLCCKTSSTGTQPDNTAMPDNSQTSVDWEGVYYGVLPCADCPGIQTTVHLNNDLSYRLQLNYQGKADSSREYTGKFTWNKEGNIITLENAGNTDFIYRYAAGENRLTQLDKDGKQITGNLASQYVLSKDNYALLEKYWKLVELYGQSIPIDSNFTIEPHITFKLAESRFTGHGGCNNFSGTYMLGSNNRISIPNALATKMACPQMEIETKFFQALHAADNFIVVGDTLVLNKARMAPLAKFQAVYMK